MELTFVAETIPQPFALHSRLPFLLRLKMEKSGPSNTFPARAHAIRGPYQVSPSSLTTPPHPLTGSGRYHEC